LTSEQTVGYPEIVQRLPTEQSDQARLCLGGSDG
jgi:hypothetical protein